MFLNGAPVSAEELAPGFCAYDCWLPYQTYDVTAQLRSGENILGAWLGNGYYKGRVSWPGTEAPPYLPVRQTSMALIAELAVELRRWHAALLISHRRNAGRRAAARFAAGGDLRRRGVSTARLWDRPRTAFAPGFDDACWRGVRARGAWTPSLLQPRGRIVPVQCGGRAPRRARLLRAPKGEDVAGLRAESPAAVGASVAERARGRGDPRAIRARCWIRTGILYRENLRTALAEHGLHHARGRAPSDCAAAFTFFGFPLCPGARAGHGRAFARTASRSAWSAIRTMERTGEFELLGSRA